jgi:type IV secretory pathway protease TraF
MVRAELLGKAPDDLTIAEVGRAYGNGPDNPATAPADAYLLLGDNSPHSLDGRDWGWVPAENLRGRAWLVVFPPQRWRVIR